MSYFNSDNKQINLLLGDCLELMENIPDNSVDMILCDLPYQRTQCEWDIMISLGKLWNQYNRITKERTPIVLFGIEPFSSMLRMSNLSMYKYDWVWDKVRGTGFLNSKKQPMRNHEFVHVFYKKQCLYNPQITHGHQLKQSNKSKELQSDVYGKTAKNCKYSSTSRYPRSIQVFSTDTQKSALHPTQKPIALCEYLIKTYTNENDLVLDNCMGSGTTGVACTNLNRRFIGMELDNEFYNTAVTRIESLVNHESIH